MRSVVLSALLNEKFVSAPLSIVCVTCNVMIPGTKGSVQGLSVSWVESVVRQGRAGEVRAEHSAVSEHSVVVEHGVVVEHSVVAEHGVVAERGVVAEPGVVEEHSVVEDG